MDRDDRVPGEEWSPALALVSSHHTSNRGLVDRLERAEDALAWLVERGLVPAGTPLSAAHLAALQELRGAVRTVFVARIKGTVPPEGAVATINRVASMAPIAPKLSWTVPDQPAVHRCAVGGDALAHVLAIMASDAIDVVCGGTLRACVAPGCTRLFAKDHGRRHWCSTACGDRVRAARYYARHRQDPARSRREQHIPKVIERGEPGDR